MFSKYFVSRDFKSNIQQLAEFLTETERPEASVADDITSSVAPAQDLLPTSLPAPAADSINGVEEGSGGRQVRLLFSNTIVCNLSKQF